MISILFFERLKKIRPIEDLFFKQRTVFQIGRDEYVQKPIENDEYYIKELTGDEIYIDLDKESLQFLNEEIGRTKVSNRLEFENCSLFLAKQRTDDTPVGFYWSVVSRNFSIWHDSFRVPPDCGFVFNAYVTPTHRQNGIYRLLQEATHNHLFSNEMCGVVFTVVEDRNTPSIRANESFGLSPYAKNYLIKFLSINILSVIANENERTVHFVLPKSDL